jgi:predicted DNA-binding transcriptional regulator AlpA
MEILYHRRVMQNNHNPLQPTLLRRPEAWRLLGIGPSTYKALVGKGILREVAIGQRGRRLPYSEIERYVSERLAEAAAAQ